MLLPEPVLSTTPPCLLDYKKRMPCGEQQLREDVVVAGRMMYERGWIAANDGNLTVRLDGERILATPAGVCKGRMRPEDLIVCDASGNKIAGAGKRTTEMAMHVAIYGARPDICSVVHAHPPI